MKLRNLRWLPTPWLVLLALAAPLAAVQPAAAQHEHEHEAGVHALELNNGKKWSTDAPLRRGMSAIRNAVARDHHAIHDNAQTAAQYQALAGKIDEQIAYMVANCRLIPKADAALHVILADIIAGADLMKGGDQAKRRAGAVKVVGALRRYPDYFDHPGWRALE